MRIQHNIMAMNAYRNYNNNTSALSKNLEKLSSGYKINRAGDDAAGLAISEKMRAQISGLNAAQKNVKDGISLVKTAEGAMQEVQDMLNRMAYLANQSANGTYDNEVDRANLQKEVDSLKSEINRIADSANFNGIKLLDGSLANTAAANSTNVDVTIVNDGQLGNKPQAGIFSIDLSNVTLTAKNNAEDPTFTLFGKTVTLTQLANKGDTVSGDALATDIVTKWNDGAGQTIHGALVKAEAKGSKITFTMQDAPTEEWTTAAGNASLGVAGSNQAEQITVTVEQEPIDSTKGRLYAQGSIELDDTLVADGKTLTIGKTTYTFAVGKTSAFKNAANVIDLTDLKQEDITTNINVAANRLSKAAANNAMFKVGANTQDGVIHLTERDGAVDYAVNNLAGTTNPGDGDWTGLVKSGTAVANGGLTLQIGDTADSFNQMSINVADIHTNALNISNLDISSQSGAAAAVDVIKAAINTVSSTRGDLGAVQNRLEHTQNNLSVMAENITDAESSIRDTDVADEMMAYTKNNILIQSAQAMLAQANQVPQGVLQLLQ